MIIENSLIDDLSSISYGKRKLTVENAVNIATEALDKVSMITEDAPDLLDTLKEISDALGNDPQFATNVKKDITKIKQDLNTESDRVDAVITSVDKKVDKKTGYDLVANTKVAGYDNHVVNTSNPHKVTKSQVGLSNVDNTSDANKPVSTATKTALSTKVDKVSGKQLSTEDYTTEDKNKVALLGNEALENMLAYGVVRDVDSLNPTFVRIGNMQLHRTLPIHNKMRGCTLKDDGTVSHYFNDGWTANEDGSPIIKDGTDGMVMIEIPEFYLKLVTGFKEGYLISEQPLAGFTKIAKSYVSAYEATTDRTVSNKIKLASVVNNSTAFRGGNNNASLDDAENTQLGKPATAINLANARTYARNRHISGNIYGAYSWNVYDAYLHNILWILYTVEYASTNSQLSVNNKLTADGCKQGGLGSGVSPLDGTKWNAFNGYYPVIPCGTSDSLGNGSGEVVYTMPASYDTKEVTVKVARYRGIENPFGHIFKIVDGALFNIKTDADGGTSDILYCTDPKYYSSSINEHYKNLGQLPRTNGYPVKVVNGTVFPLELGSSSTTGLCDYFYTDVASSFLASCRIGGDAHFGYYAGLACVGSSSSVAGSLARYGFRLAFRTDASK